MQKNFEIEQEVPEMWGFKGLEMILPRETKKEEKIPLCPFGPRSWQCFIYLGRIFTPGMHVYSMQFTFDFGSTFKLISFVLKFFLLFHCHLEIAAALQSGPNRRECKIRNIFLSNFQKKLRLDRMS